MVSFAIAVPHYAPPLDPSANTAAWSQAASLPLAWDVVRRRTASEPTTVYVASDGKAIYVRFEATQREPISASERSNDVGQGSDDAVWVDLWPNGSTGFYYQFQVTPNGTHYESSSENASYQPSWESHGSPRADGYTATLRIPLEILRGASGKQWRAQFVRYIHATGEEQVWSYDANQVLPDDFARSGTLTMPANGSSVASRAQPRLALYGLGEAAPRSIGGATSHVGADVSVPITPTASLYATFHPDFSNVELDQQSISPTVYQRYFSEVRPFFTQGASLYNNIRYYITNSPIQPLYTASIPTPSQGYAIEGRQGQFALGGFDAIGDNRTDAAGVVNYTTSDSRFEGSLQRVDVDTPTLADTTTNASFQYNSLAHTSAYLDYGNDSGTNVLAGNDAQWYDAGALWTSKTFTVAGAARKIGDYYNPVDGYIFHPGIAGYGLYGAKIFDFTGNSKLVSAGLNLQYDRYQGQTGGSNQSDNQWDFDVLTKSALDFQVYTGSDYWRFGNALTPVSQSGGVLLTYHSGLQTNNPNNFPYHGTSATPTTVSYTTGLYGAGRLDTWVRTSTIRTGARGTVTLTVDNTAQWFRDATANVQWFDSFSYADQISADSSFAIGLRRVVGLPPQPNGGGNCSGTCTNVSLAYHYRLRHSELYLAYGDPNTLTTIPQALFKLIFYAGADKGT